MKNNYLKLGLMRSIFTSVLAMLALISPEISMAQMVQQTESFESATLPAQAIFPSPGWRQLKYPTNVNAAFVLQAAATATNPACGVAPGGGSNVMMFNSFVGTNNDTSIIITKPFDFSNNAGVNPQFSFYMFRDNGFAANNDHIRVYINTSPSMSGATLLSNTLGFNQMSRYYNTAPIAPVANTWNQYTYDLNAATYTAKRYYFIIMGVCKDGNNMYFDRVTTNTFPSATLASDVRINMFFQNGASVGTNVKNHIIVGMRCVIAGTSGCGVVNGGASTAVKLDSLLLNTNGTTNVLDIENAKIYYTGGSTLFDTTYVSPFPAVGVESYPVRRYSSTIAVPGTNLNFFNAPSSCFYLEYDTTYFWLTYDIKATATGGNFVDADLRGSAVGGTPGSCPSPGGTGLSVVPDPGGFSLVGASQIDLPYCVGTYTTGTSWLNGSYTNNDYITHVKLTGASGTAINTTVGAKNNNTGLPVGLFCYPNCDFTAHPPDYELWPAVPGRTVTLTQGVGYSVEVRAGTWASSNNIAAFIDFNRDGDFLDAGEKLGQVTLGGLAIGNIPFAVPAAGYTGVTRMRVREVFANGNIDPCAQYTFGEIEDFTIIISPNCNPAFKLWLGNTDDWNNPGNWCGGIPSITDDAVVDRTQVFPPTGNPTRPYFRPTIKSNILANANNLTISTLDSVLINSPTPGAYSLKIRKDLINNGRVKVLSSFTANPVFSNGTLSNAATTPFKAQDTDARTQIIYTQAELTLAGLVAGDNITGIKFNILTKNSTANYNGFNIGYALVAFTQHASNVPYAGALTTVYSPGAFATVAGINTINFTTPIVWDGSNSILIQYCFDNASNIGPGADLMNLTQTTGIKSTLILSSFTNASPGCVMVPGGGVSDNAFSFLGTYRPNFTFLLERPYGKALITVQEDWLNNGFFDAGYSRVRMDSSVVQTIAGTQPTTFNEIEVNKGAASQTVTMMRAITVDSSVVLSQGQLRMNTYTLTMNNPLPVGGTVVAPTGAFTRTNGFLISESVTASVIWKNINSSYGFRLVPFGNAAIASPLYIPFSFLHKSGDMGDLDISTYNAPLNLPLPPTVSHLNNLAGANNAAAVVDRYWMLSKTGPNPQADITFRWTTAERPAGMVLLPFPNPGKAQPWWASGQNRSWIRLTAPYTVLSYSQNYNVNVTPPFDSVRVIGWDWPILPVGPAPYFAASGPIGNSNPWTVSLNNTPLPIELVNFDAKLVDKKVKLSWTTASEINNDYFTVERADKDLTKFDFIAKVNSYMQNSSMMLNYETWDENPMQGLQYYRLKQTDLDGEFTYSDMKPVYMGAVKSFEITSVYGNSLNNGQFQIEFVYDSELPLSAIITDATGRVIYNQGGIAAQPGMNKIQLDQNLSQGIYFIILQNQEKKVSQKFFY